MKYPWQHQLAGMGVLVAVAVGVTVGVVVDVGVMVGVLVAVGVTVGVLVTVGVTVGEGVLHPVSPYWQRRASSVVTIPSPFESHAGQSESGLSPM